MLRCGFTFECLAEVLGRVFVAKMCELHVLCSAQMHVKCFSCKNIQATQAWQARLDGHFSRFEGLFGRFLGHSRPSHKARVLNIESRRASID